MTIRVRETTRSVAPVRTRLPFAFGDVTVREIPHLFVSAIVDVDGRERRGVAADHAMPKWFRKDPACSVADDVAAILEAAGEACRIARGIEAPTPFAFWRRLHDEHAAWAEDRYPPLLANFGVSLLERALIDATCRARGTDFGTAVRTGELGIEPGAVYPDLEGMDPATALPPEPRRSVAVRHTVGLADPLTDVDLDAPLEDGLPETLTDYVERDGVRYFKCKVGGDPERDLDRLADIAGVLDSSPLESYAVTVDANEGYGSIEDLERLRRGLAERDALERFAEAVLCIEQPLDRDAALSADVGAALADWEGPPVIIDESDDRPGTLGRALELGYAGTSFKSCKGVFKGLIDACLVERRRRQGEEVLLTAEDLTTVGPVSLGQDLAAVATLGLAHAERNGHHYFRGLSMFPDEVGERARAAHGDLYREHPDGFTAVDLSGGRLRLDSVIGAPYGVGIDIDADRFVPAEDWDPDRLDVERRAP